MNFKPDWQGHGRSRSCMTPNGWIITPHAWDRMFHPPHYRIKASPKEVDRLITMATKEFDRRRTRWGESIMLGISLTYYWQESKKKTKHIFKAAVNKKQKRIITVVKIGKRGLNKDVVWKRYTKKKKSNVYKFQLKSAINNPPMPSILDLEEEF